MAASGMVDVAVPVAVAPSAIWTAIRTAAAAETVEIQNRHNSVDLLVRCTGATTAATDAADAAAIYLRPRERFRYVLANGDKVFAKPVDDSGPAGRVTVAFNS